MITYVVKPYNDEPRPTNSITFFVRNGVVE